jgi:hypothetical protein
LQKLLSTNLSSDFPYVQGSQPGASVNSAEGGQIMTGPDGKQYNVPANQVAAFKAAGGQ